MVEIARPLGVNISIIARTIAQLEKKERWLLCIVRINARLLIIVGTIINPFPAPASNYIIGDVMPSGERKMPAGKLGGGELFPPAW